MYAVFRVYPIKPTLFNDIPSYKGKWVDCIKTPTLYGAAKTREYLENKYPKHNYDIEQSFVTYA